MLRNRFATAKHLAKWGFGCEIESFLCFAAVSQLQNTLQNGALAAKLGVFYASQPFRSCKTPCEMGRWLRNWQFFMRRSHFVVAK